MDLLTLNEKVGANYMLMELIGSLNAYTMSDFQEKVYRYILDSHIVVDMSQVVNIDSSGLGVILAGINDGEEYGTKLFIMNPSPAAEQAFLKTGFMDSFRIIHSVTEVDDN